MTDTTIMGKFSSDCFKDRSIEVRSSSGVVTFLCILLLSNFSKSWAQTTESTKFATEKEQIYLDMGFVIYPPRQHRNLDPEFQKQKTAEFESQEAVSRSQTALAEAGVAVNVVSMPSTTTFDKQDKAWRDRVLPAGLPRVAIEAGHPDGWYKYVGLDGAVVGLARFGESAPAGLLFKEFGFTVENIINTVRGVLSK